MDPTLVEHILAFVLGAVGGLCREIMATESSWTYVARSVILGGVNGLLFKFSGAPNHAGTLLAGYTMSHLLGHAYEKVKEKVSE